MVPEKACRKSALGKGSSMCRGPREDMNLVPIRSNKKLEESQGLSKVVLRE